MEVTVTRGAKETITITFCDVAENHAGMQRIGVEQKLSLRSLVPIMKYYRSRGFDVDCYLLDERGLASVIVVRRFLPESNKLFQSLRQLDWDKKALFNGVVKNKRKRYNLCFADYNQEPNYAEGHGRVIPFTSVTELDEIRQSLEAMFRKALNANVTLVAEGNYYYNKNCGIGYHGDEERNIVVGLRLGHPMKLLYRWYCDGQPISSEIEVPLAAGDLYFMSDKAVGKDWRQEGRSVRHSAHF